MIWELLEPKFKLIKPDDEFGKFHEAIADALNTFFSVNLAKQIFTADGIVTSGTTTVPFKAICVKLTNTYIGITQGLVMSGLSVKDEGFPMLFKLIGNQLAMSCGIWDGSPVINGICTVMFSTEHFYEVGVDLVDNLKNLKPFIYDGEKYIPDDTIQKQMWDLIELKLIEAVNRISVEVPELTGATAGGVFTGIATIKLAF